MAKFTMAVSSADKLKKNATVAKTLHLQDTPKMQAITGYFTRLVEGAKIEFLGPLPTGGTLLRITALPAKGQKVLKAHVEISLTAKEAQKMALKEAFYQDLAALKLSQFTGYMAEHHVMQAAKAGTLHTKMFLPALGKKVATAFGRPLISSSVFSLQNASGHGIDFFAELLPPPPNQWITMDIKATMRKSFSDWGTPKTPPLSEVQKKAIPNLMSHINDALALIKKGNPYNLTKEQFSNLVKFRDAYKTNPRCITAYELKLGLEEGFAVASNKKYPSMMILKLIN